LGGRERTTPSFTAQNEQPGEKSAVTASGRRGGGLKFLREEAPPERGSSLSLERKEGKTMV